MKILINNNFANEFQDVLGVPCIPLPPYENLDFPVASHADMLFFILDNVVFCYEDYVKKNGIDMVLKSEGYTLFFVSKKCEKSYPNDVSLNVLKMDNLILCSEKCVAKEIVEYAKNNGYKLVFVNQGYSACSTLIIDENNAITSDKGIYNALVKENKNVLLASNEGICLHGYNCGFFGGASGVFKKKIYFWGDINSLDGYTKIEDFISKCGFEICSISQGKVYDFGGFKVI